MRIFIGYGYNERDRWIEQYVAPLVTAFGCEVVHGKAVYGGALPEEVVKLIRTSDALIGFTTRRDSVGPDLYRTHDWVVQELVTANAQDPRIPWVEVREEGVLPPGGVLDSADAQRIDYREADRALCLVRIAEALRRFRELTGVTTIRLGPAAAVDAINPFLDDPSFICTCQTLRGAVASQPHFSGTSRPRRCHQREIFNWRKIPPLIGNTGMGRPPPFRQQSARRGAGRRSGRAGPRPFARTINAWQSWGPGSLSRGPSPAEQGCGT